MPKAGKSKTPPQIAVKVYVSTKADLALLRRAAKLSRKKLSPFIRDAAIEAAERCEEKAAQIPHIVNERSA